MNDPCQGCRHYRPPKQHELVGYCHRIEPQKVTWEERTDGECGRDGRYYETAQPDLFRKHVLCGGVE
jgi:hypothetical protein